MDPQFTAFFVLSALLTITPGADMALVTRNTLVAGRGAALFTTLGISSGIALHAFMWAIGLSAIISRSATLYDAVRFVGAGYIIYLGLRSLLGSGKHGLLGDAVPGAAESGPSRPLGRYFSQGLLTNVLNPKVALFYLTFLPQFISPNDPVIAKALFLAGIHIALGIIWLTGYSYMLGRLSAVLTRADVRRRLEQVTGVLLIALGIRLLWERR